MTSPTAPHQNQQDLLEFIVCPACGDDGKLVRRGASDDEARDWQTLLRESAPPKDAFECSQCGTGYPITFDDIPVLWSASLRESFHELVDDRVDHAAPKEADVKAANIFVYEEISSNYDDAMVHADGVSRSRLFDALKDYTEEPAGWHLDVGCGPGNTLDAIQLPASTTKIGVDISLKGLRIAKAKGFHAVLGDAEQLPIRSGSMALITASSVLHHLFAPERFVEESCRALKPGGVLFTDFDPNRAATDFKWIVRFAFRMRLPIYRALSRFLKKKVGHSSKNVQQWNQVAEFHNQPGSGFSYDELAQMIEKAGLIPKLIFLHISKTTGSVDETAAVRPHLRHVFTQTFSGRNPYNRDNCDTVLTVSEKPR